MPTPPRTTREISPSPAPRAFSLIELLVVIAVIALLVGLLIPALSRSIGLARSFQCQVALRSIGFDYGVFTDDTLNGGRGEDESIAPRFRLQTFQEAEYGLDEFWRWGDKSSHSLPDAQNNNPMRCAEVDGAIVLRRGVPCGEGAISPVENLSYTFNGRLDRAPVRGTGGRRWMQTALTPDAATQPSVPLAWDVDGAEAARRGVSAVFSAPGLDTQFGPFAGDAMWFPSGRHNGATNVLLTDLSVKSTSKLLEEQWKWDYTPRR